MQIEKPDARENYGRCGIDDMAKKLGVDEEMLDLVGLIGMCLLCVQQAEEVLSGVVETILDRPEQNLTEQSEVKQRQTLGDFLKRLKQRVKVEYGLKERLFKFLQMRNTFVHKLSEVPGLDLETEKGRAVARMFVGELCMTALFISMLFTTLFSVSAKDDLGADLFRDEDEQTQKMAAMLEKLLGEKARKILAGRYQKPAFGRARPK